MTTVTASSESASTNVLLIDTYTFSASFFIEDGPEDGVQHLFRFLGTIVAWQKGVKSLLKTKAKVTRLVERLHRHAISLRRGDSELRQGLSPSV
ncbi:hypothetical protein FKP32DRAFT_1599083 [Trametes sanguinea]|nr:hypothetical protein FKP32DRAFT_1599083 [Trametes sanguinea]